MKRLAARAWALLKRWGLFAAGALVALSPLLDAMTGVDLNVVLTPVLGERAAPVLAGVLILLANLARSPLVQKDPA